MKGKETTKSKKRVKGGLRYFYSVAKEHIYKQLSHDQQHGSDGDTLGADPWTCHLVAVPQFPQLGNKATNGVYRML